MHKDTENPQGRRHLPVFRRSWLVLPVVAALAATRLTTAGADVSECFVLVQPDGTAVVSDVGECAHRTAPASTFKLPHALIALQAGVIDETTVVRWNGTPYDFEAWQHDHTLASAIRASVYPFFQHTARLIGRERMRESLRALDYGSATFDGELTAFWINGALTISPREQVDFLRRMFDRRLPIEPRHLDVVSRALVMPPGRFTNASGSHPFPLRWPAGSIVRAKTGNTIVAGERVSWLVGSIQVAGHQHVFAGRVRSRKALDSSAGAALALRWLNDHRPPPRP